MKANTNAPTNGSTALKLIPGKVKVKCKKRTANSKTPDFSFTESRSAIDASPLYLKVEKSEYLKVRRNLRKKVNILHSAAFLLEMAGLIGEVAFLAAGNLLNTYFTTVLDASSSVSVTASICVAIAGLIFGAVCVGFAISLHGVAETISKETKKLMPVD